MSIAEPFAPPERSRCVTCWKTGMDTYECIHGVIMGELVTSIGISRMTTAVEPWSCASDASDAGNADEAGNRWV